jgi:hypothetical protein
MPLTYWGTHPRASGAPDMLSLTIQDLHAQVGNILLCWDMGNKGFTRYKGLMYCMGTDHI